MRDADNRLADGDDDYVLHFEPSTNTAGGVDGEVEDDESMYFVANDLDRFLDREHHRWAPPRCR